MSKDLRNQEIPDCLMVAVCEAVVIDQMTNNKSLINMFNRVHAVGFPVLHPRLCVVVSLTNGRGTLPLVMRMKHLSSDEVIHSMSGRVVFGDPMAVHDLVFDFRGVLFSKAGDYVVELVSGERIVGQRRFAVELGRPQA